MLTGTVPFKASQEWLTFQQIINVEYTFPEDFDPLAKDLIQRLLVKDSEKRLGAGRKNSKYDF